MPSAPVAPGSPGPVILPPIDSTSRATAAAAAEGSWGLGARESAARDSTAQEGGARGGETGEGGARETESGAKEAALAQQEATMSEVRRREQGQERERERERERRAKLESAIATIKNGTSAATVDLSHLGLGDEGVAELAEALRFSSTSGVTSSVTSLLLRNNNISDKGVAELAEAIKSKGEGGRGRGRG